MEGLSFTQQESMRRFKGHSTERDAIERKLRRKNLTDEKRGRLEVRIAELASLIGEDVDGSHSGVHLRVERHIRLAGMPEPS